MTNMVLNKPPQPVRFQIKIQQMRGREYMASRGLTIYATDKITVDEIWKRISSTLAELVSESQP